MTVFGNVPGGVTRHTTPPLVTPASGTLKFGYANIRTKGAARAALAGGVASQLPGRNGGPADAFRHILIAAELYRRFPPGTANEWLGKHEGDENLAVTYNQDTYMNNVGRLIGIHVRDQGGRFEDIKKIAYRYMEANLAEIDQNTIIRTWIKSGGSDESGTSFLINPKIKNISINGLKLPGIALRHPYLWKGNPVVDDTKNTPAKLNWPDKSGDWIGRFNFNGAEQYNTYDGGESYKTEKPDSNLLQKEKSEKETAHDNAPLLNEELSANKSTPINQDIKAEKRSFTSPPQPHEAVRLGFSAQPVEMQHPSELSRFVARNTPSKNKPEGIDTLSGAHRIRMTDPREHHADNDQISIEDLDRPTPEMLENNVFRKDENGKTNLTNEAKIWKKNKKLAGKLIALAGRQKEFPHFFPEDENA